MKRIILMVPAELLERIDADAKKCVCGNRSVHLRHVLSTILKAQ